MGHGNSESDVAYMFVFPGDQRDVFSELSALRRQLRSEQKRLEGCLQDGDWEELDSPLSDRSGPDRRCTLMHFVDIFVDVYSHILKLGSDMSK